MKNKSKTREIIMDIIVSCEKNGQHVNPYKKEIDIWEAELYASQEQGGSKEERPDITNFFDSQTSTGNIQKLFSNSPKLYSYINALDGYIDYLEQGCKCESTSSQREDVPSREMKITTAKEEKIKKQKKNCQYFHTNGYCEANCNNLNNCE